MLEKEFFKIAKENRENGISVRETIEMIGEAKLPHKRAWYWLGKWSQKGLYDYGVTIDLGWFNKGENK